MASAENWTKVQKDPTCTPEIVKNKQINSQWLFLSANRFVSNFKEAKDDINRKARLSLT